MRRSRPAPIPGQPYVNAEFLFAVRSEMATSLIDLVTRRTRAHLHDARATLAAAPSIAQLVAPELGWDATQVTSQVEAYRAFVHREFEAAGIAL